MITCSGIVYFLVQVPEPEPMKPSCYILLDENLVISLNWQHGRVEGPSNHKNTPTRHTDDPTPRRLAFACVLGLPSLVRRSASLASVLACLPSSAHTTESNGELQHPKARVLDYMRNEKETPRQPRERTEGGVLGDLLDGEPCTCLLQ